jgi:hypothetical protein
MALIVDGTGKRDNRLVTNEFTVTAYTEDLALAGNEAGAANVAAVLATLLKVLIEKGIIEGSVNS